MARLTVEHMEENLAFFNNQDAETLRKLRRISEDTNRVGGATCEMRVIYNDAYYLFCPALNARPNANGEMRCSKHYGIMLHSTCIIGGDDPELWKFIDSVLAWKAEPEKQKHKPLPLSTIPPLTPLEIRQRVNEGRRQARMMKAFRDQVCLTGLILKFPENERKSLAHGFFLGRKASNTEAWHYARVASLTFKYWIKPIEG